MHTVEIVLLVLLLAISMKWEWISMERVDFVNTMIKAVSACFADNRHPE